MCLPQGENNTPLYRLVCFVGVGSSYCNGVVLLYVSRFSPSTLATDVGVGLFFHSSVCIPLGCKVAITINFTNERLSLFVLPFLLDLFLARDMTSLMFLRTHS
mmetsp:Transcript_1150/g.2599  ORF Transcript_1150/g.2599 Transcript_1150/m.2599 type:complete len:103 (-) Transcript_1150:92-400(-)